MAEVHENTFYLLNSTTERKMFDIGGKNTAGEESKVRLLKGEIGTTYFLKIALQNPSGKLQPSILWRKLSHLRAPRLPGEHTGKVGEIVVIIWK